MIQNSCLHTHTQTRINLEYTRRTHARLLPLYEVTHSDSGADGRRRIQFGKSFDARPLAIPASASCFSLMRELTKLSNFSMCGECMRRRGYNPRTHTRSQSRQEASGGCWHTQTALSRCRATAFYRLHRDVACMYVSVPTFLPPHQHNTQRCI